MKKKKPSSPSAPHQEKQTKMGTRDLKSEGSDSPGNGIRWRKWKAKRAGSLRTGEDLKAWRLKHGLYLREVGELLGLHQTTISVAERSIRLSPGVKRAVMLLQEAIEAGDVDVQGIVAHRKPRGRPRK